MMEEGQHHIAEQSVRWEILPWQSMENKIFHAVYQEERL